MFTSTDDEIEALADAVGVLRKVALPYRAPVNTCAAPGCDVPTSGVFCLSCATK